MNPNDFRPPMNFPNQSEIHSHQIHGEDRTFHAESQYRQNQRQFPTTATATATHNNHAINNSKDVVRHRITFAIFLKVLIGILERTEQTTASNGARLVVRTCCRKHKVGDPRYRSLERSIERDLKSLIDKTTWTKARQYTLYFLRQQRKKHLAGQPVAIGPIMPTATVHGQGRVGQEQQEQQHHHHYPSYSNY